MKKSPWRQPTQIIDDNYLDEYSSIDKFKDSLLKTSLIMQNSKTDDTFEQDDTVI